MSISILAEIFSKVLDAEEALEKASSKSDEVVEKAQKVMEETLRKAKKAILKAQASLKEDEVEKMDQSPRITEEIKERRIFRKAREIPLSKQNRGGRNAERGLPAFCRKNWS